MSNYIRQNRSFEDLSMPSLINTTLSSDNASFFSISAREWPILIGAIVGAIGLVILIFCAISIWFCCQYANSSNSYRLSEEDSDSCNNLSYDEENKNGRINDQRNFSKIDRVLLLRPSAMDLCRDTSRNMSNLTSMSSVTNHLPVNYQLGQSPALLNARQIDTQSNDMIDPRYLNALTNAQSSVINLY